jgi:lipid-A-disaccharide synthase-like uncharacterized protein
MLHDLLNVIAQPMGLLGLLGQICFFSRFLVQWMASEKEQKSVMPVAFWYLSLVGGSMVLVYALWRHDPVFILGQSIGLLVYTRNLMLIYGKRARAESTEA